MSVNLLGIDFEEWYHPELIQRFLTNEKRTPKIIFGIDKILNLLQKYETFATFFIVGEIIEENPEIQDKILSNGHEIAFHTMHHEQLWKISPDEFDTQIKKFQQLTNNRSKGFRAPTFSLNQKSSWVIDILEKNGYVYDSSIVPAKSSMYGVPDAPSYSYKISSSSINKNSPSGKITEFPIMITKFFGKKIPAGGGFYLRTLPFRTIKKAIQTNQQKSQPSVFYIHSWELTPELFPQLKLNAKDHFITYHNLEKTPKKIENLLKAYNFTSFENYMHKF